MRIFYVLHLLVVISMLSDFNSEVTIKNDFEKRETGKYIPEFLVIDSDTLPYQILLPNNYHAATKLPLLFFLHGSGERGSNNTSQLIHGSSLFKDSINEYPCIVVFPQCASDDWWANNAINSGLPDGYPPYTDISLKPANPSMALLELLIDSLINHEKVDDSRVYVAGLSMGGMGTAQLLARFPDTFAAGVVICGVAPLDYADDLKKTPTWIFHGLADKVVSPAHSKDYFSAIDDNTGKHRLSLYGGVGHGAWNNAFAEPDFLNWIFSHSK